MRDDKLFLDFIPESYCEPLEKAGAQKKRGQCRMLRPTTKENVLLNKDYYFSTPATADQEEIIEVVYESHLHGYTSTVTGLPDRKKWESLLIVASPHFQRRIHWTSARLSRTVRIIK